MNLKIPALREHSRGMGKRVRNFFSLKGQSFLEIAAFVFKIEFAVILSQEVCLRILLDGPTKYRWSILKNVFLVGTPVAFLLVSLVFLLIGRLYLSLILANAMILALTIIHYFKVSLLGMPLFFWDHILLVEALRALPLLASPVLIYGLLTVAVGGLGFFAWKLSRTDGVRMTILSRCSLAAASVLVVWLTLFCLRVSYEDFFPRVVFRRSLVMRIGFLPFLAKSVGHAGGTPEPEGYSQEAIAKIVQKYESLLETTAPLKSFSEKPPDIIFYVLESVMDYQRVGVRYKTDPMPFFNELKKQSGESYFISPTFAGETIQPEFELITGLSQFMVNSPNPMNFINQSVHPFPSFCEGLKPMGYYCMGINAAQVDNFQRDRAYQRFHFDKFLGLETHYKDVSFARVGYDRIPDAMLVKTFLEERPKDKPVFAYIMTNSTHALYEDWEALPQFEVLNTKLSDSVKDSLQRYASALKQADDALRKFIEHLKKQDGPVLLLTYGDHLPPLRTEYKQLGVEKRPDWEVLEKHLTPLRVWSSDGSFEKKDFMISSNLMGALIQSHIKDPSKMPTQFKIALELYKRWNVVSRTLIDKNAKVTVRTQTSSKTDETLRDYELIQYDLLHGRRYSLDGKPGSGVDRS